MMSPATENKEQPEAAASPSAPAEAEEPAAAALEDDGGGEEMGGQVEKFDGKIVYNPDGSAYIIDGDDNEAEDAIPKQEGSNVDEPCEGNEISNAVFISKSSAYYNSLYGRAYVKMMQEKNIVNPETPVVHSYRVYNPREEGDRADRSEAKLPSSLAEFATVPVKPVLMCFVCKLSFGCADTFGSHCVDGHSIELSGEERSVLDSKNSSAIIQGKGKEASVSFLEPIVSQNGGSSNPPPPTPVSGAITSLLAAAAAAAGGQFPKVPTTSPSPSPSSASLMRPPSTSSPRIPTPTSPSVDNTRRSPSSTPRSSAVSPSVDNSSTSPPVAIRSDLITPPVVPPTAAPVTYPASLPTNANMLQGTTIGACPDHVNGRPTGVECAKCDLILNQSRLSSMGWNVSRNSCKTLKCPKCNWHYKYQETLEIHMKEKHPESETTCIYCITGQQHPRLARGETYTCGYKPYRCEVCNYSTTTKGNLSIHMQSDKHLNNMQEIQNGGIVSNPDSGSPKPPTSSPAPRASLPPPPPTMTSPSPLASPSKQKPSWRCDVCNYETNVARNLRIHMTSEKHTHNMMSLQQSAAGKMLPPGFPTLPMPGLDPKQFLAALAAGGGAAGLLNPPPPPPPAPTSSPGSEQAAMADLAYNQALLAQMMSGGQFPGGPPPDFSSLLAATAAAAGMEPHDNEPPPEPTDPNPRHLFTCCVCRNYGCDSVDELSQHLSQDRSRTRENEVSIVIGGNSLCQLCNYKTNLKANFQLHCKTDKHLQRLSHVNHIKEGGQANEWKLRYLTSLNPVELRCNACDFYTNSPHKLQVHIANQQHQVSALLFFHLQKMERRSTKSGLSYNCTLCQFSAAGKHLLMVHVRSPKHLQMEQFHQLKKRAEGNTAQTEIGEIFQVVEDDDDSNEADKSKSSSDSTICCPLCQENFEGQEAMESHAMTAHSVNTEGLQRLQALMGASRKSPQSQKGLGSPSSERKETENPAASNAGLPRKGDLGFNYSLDKYLDPNRPFKCDVCKESFTQKNILLVHYNSVSHLHKLKKTMQEQQGKQQSVAEAAPTPSTPEKTPTKGSALEAVLGNIRKEADDEFKPFKCNICKVAYSQGSTLDIHIRSVLHQTKASKLQELILTGQIDLSKPLIEQPDPQQLQDQHKKMISEMLSPNSLNSTGSTNNSQSSPNAVRNSSPNRSSPHSSPLASLAPPKSTSSPTEGSSGSADEAAAPNSLAKTFPFLANVSSPGEDEKQSPVLKNLLQNMGMEQLFKNLNDKQQQQQQQQQREEEAAKQQVEAEKPSKLSEVQEALQKAMIQAQLQQMNPMLMQMNQLQGLNPLAAMNLHPPLIPPALLKGGATNPNDITAAILAQMQSTQQLLAGQAGPAGGMDPKVLALMAASMQGQQPTGDQAVPDLVKMLGEKAPKPPGLFNPLAGLDPKVRPGPQVPPVPALDPKQFPMPGSPFPGMPDPKALLMQQQPIPNMEQGKRARTRITDEQLKVLRSYFDINNSPTEEQLKTMAGQTGLPMKVIKHWFRNTLFKERQKNKDSPYNFNNPPSTKLNLEEYEKTGESKVTPLNPEEQGEYMNAEKIKRELEKQQQQQQQSRQQSVSPALKTEQPVKSESPDDHEPPQQQVQTNNGGGGVNSEEPNATTTNKVPTTLNESSSAESSLTLPQLLSSQLSQLPQLPQLPPGNLLPNFPMLPNASGASALTPEYLNSLANSLNNPATSAAPPLPTTPTSMSEPPQARSISPQSVGGSGKRANRTRFTDYQIKVLQEFFENNAYPKDDDLEYLSKLLGLSPRVIVVWFQNARQKARKIYENQPPTEPQEGEDSGRFTRTAGCNYQCKKCLLVFQRYYELIRHQKQHCYKEEDAKRSAQAQKAAAQAAAQFAGATPPALMPISEDSNCGSDRSITSPAQEPDQRSNPDELKIKSADLSEMTKDAVNRMFGGGGGGGSQFPALSYPPNSAFGILQQQALQQQQQMQQTNHEPDVEQHDNNSIASSSPSSTNKRKLSEDGANEDGHEDKRLRTSILPEQLDFLGKRFADDPNPGGRALEQIAGEVGLSRKLVQLWFQNERRKGGNPSSLPPAAPSPAAGAPSDRPSLPESPFGVSEHLASLIPTTTAAAASAGYNLQDSMRKYYEDTMKRFMNDINAAANNGNAAAGNSLEQSKNEPAAALDLTSNFDESFDPMDDSDMANKSTDGDVAHNNVAGGNGSGGSNGSAGGGGNKRFRTQMTGVQVKMMKGIFEAYKTPTMSECSALGQEIGLQKRVVQVWFQNARAKEKRAKLQLQQATGAQEDVMPPPPEGCNVCPEFKYGHKFAVQDHLFTRAHLDNLKLAIEQGRYDPKSPGDILSHTANAIMQQQQTNGQNGQNGLVDSRNSSTDGGSSAASLPAAMLQMPAPTRELLEMSNHQNSRMLMQV